MNTSQNASENTPADQSRPFGFWITAVDRLMAARLATAFEDEGISRREWRILGIIDGTTPSGRELPDRKLRRLAGLGWIERTADGWTLTADGAAAQARLRTAVEEIRAQAAGALDPEELAAMATSLEKLARGLGYEDGMRLPRRSRAPHGDGHRGHHRGHSRAHRHEPGFGHGERFGFGHGEHPDFGRGMRPDFGRGMRPDFGRGMRPDFGRGERFGGPAAHERFGDGPGFGPEQLLRERLQGERRRGEHLRGEHLRGRGPRGGHRRHGAEHIHIHLHDGRRDG